MSFRNSKWSPEDARGWVGCQDKVILHSELLQERRVFVGKYLREIKLEPNQARSLAQPAARCRSVCNSLAAFSGFNNDSSVKYYISSVIFSSFNRYEFSVMR